jgi:hypothetical protein
VEGTGSVRRQQQDDRAVGGATYRLHHFAGEALIRIAKNAIRRIQHIATKVRRYGRVGKTCHSTNLLLTSIVVEFRFMPVDADRPGFPSSMHSFNPRSARERARFKVCRGLAVPSSTSNSTLNLALIFKMSFFPSSTFCLSNLLSNSPAL